MTSPFWQGIKGRFAPPVDPRQLPASFLDCFVADHARDRLVAMLGFLAPITPHPVSEASWTRGA